MAWALAAIAATAACERAPDPAASPPSGSEAPRQWTLLSGPWRFQASQDLTGGEAARLDDGAWKTVRVPHTWGRDAFQSAWYRLHLTRGPSPAGRRAYLVFEGVAVFADVYVNGHHLGQHRGAFTRFTFDATEHLVEGDNVIAVRANNDGTSTADSLPSGTGKQLYHLYGGIYRKAWLLETDAVHVDPLDHASSGVYVTPTRVSADGALLSIRTLVRNSSSAPRDVVVRHRIEDGDGALVDALEGSARIEPGTRGEVTVSTRVRRPKLWSTSDPHLHTVVTEVVAGEGVTDRLSERFGFRDFRWDGVRFTLNGAPILLRGVGKHQETEAELSAVSDDDLRQEWKLIQDLGANFVRLAHYPHAKLEYDLADAQGVLVWAENGHSNERKVNETGDRITREMILQNYNHPSIVMWSVGNETGYMRVNRYAEVVKATDPHRIVAYASNTGRKGKRFYPELDLIAQNTYRGWYRGDPWEFEKFALPMQLVSESGGGSVVTNHTGHAGPYHVIDEFEPEEYRQVLGEVHGQVVFRDHPDALPMYAVWNFRDFGTEKYKGVRNTKGLLTYAGFKKDVWYLFRSLLRPDAPLVHLASKTHFLRRGAADEGIKAYSNAPTLTLAVNGKDQGRRVNGAYRHRNRRAVANTFFWKAPLRPGRNLVHVRDEAGHEDVAVIYQAGRGKSAREAEEEAEGAVRELRSSNAKSPAWFIDQAVQDQWPFYHEFDASADNSFDTLPEAVRGARWISTRRLSKPEARTDLSFRLAAPATVFVMGSESAALARSLAGAGFRETGTRGRWRDDALSLVPYRLYSREAGAGERIRVPGVTADYVVLVKTGAGG
ncbi:MAG TPA: glycoside hydrolase family 2 TIM barrel-domain containing protein [Vicinamibacteria bacterium]|nr:glycoside hydrolase family 2 TIM barrel-domain containing protein [Vicinamibacteria bacterium]